MLSVIGRLRTLGAVLQEVIDVAVILNALRALNITPKWNQREAARA